MPQQKDIRLEVKVRNNLILSAMESKSITSVAELARQMGSEGTQSAIGRLVNMKEAARDEDGNWLPLAQSLADFFVCMPEDLFSEPQQYAKLEKNRTHAEITYAEVQHLTARTQEPVTPELELQAKQLRAAVARILQTLSPREERVLRMRFGFETGKVITLEEIAQEFGVNRERIRQIETKALSKLKHPARRSKIIVAAGSKKIDIESWDKHTVFSLDSDVLKAL